MRKRGGPRSFVSSWWGENFGRAVLGAWSSGLDTYDIAKKLLVPEAVVYGVLTAQRERLYSPAQRAAPVSQGAS